MMQNYGSQTWHKTLTMYTTLGFRVKILGRLLGLCRLVPQRLNLFGS